MEKVIKVRISSIKKRRDEGIIIEREKEERRMESGRKEGKERKGKERERERGNLEWKAKRRKIGGGRETILFYVVFTVIAFDIFFITTIAIIVIIIDANVTVNVVISSNIVIIIIIVFVFMLSLFLKVVFLIIRTILSLYYLPPPL